MNNIIEFNSENDMRQYLLTEKGVNFKNSIGSGAEGSCYRSRKDNLVYKINEFDNEEKLNPTEVITTQDIQLNSFAFPETLFSIDNVLEGYTARYVNNDLIKKIGEDISFIKFDSLIKAYYKMKKDVEKLSNNHIKIYDLYNNILFDGKTLTGIDTCYYSRSKENVIESNFYCLDFAVKSMVNPFFIYNDYEIDKDLDVEQYFKVLKKENKNKKILY